MRTRIEQRKLTDKEQQHILDMKTAGEKFIAECERHWPSREMALAITNAEQAVMWATKALTR